MIYITGDTHGDIYDISLQKAKKLKRTDTLIICGDFGFVWDNSKEEQKNLKVLQKLKPTVLFLDGCHENFKLLENYPLVEKFGSEVRQINDNVFQLLRGKIYTIDDKTFFTMGGGQSENVDIRLENDCYDEREMPSSEEMSAGIVTLKSNGHSVDYILTHEAPISIKEFLDMDDCFISNPMNGYLEKINQNIEFKKWFFAHYHKDAHITSQFTCVMDNLIAID